MPFQVFRRHQRKMMAALALFAMVAFSLDFSLLRNPFGAGHEDPVIVELHGRRVRASDIQEMTLQRVRANRFVSLLLGRADQPVFGDTDTRSIVDALILQAEADRLGIPADQELAKKWLKQVTNSQITAELFDRLYRQSFAGQVTDIQLLEDLANQVRIAQVVAQLPGLPVVTPLDVFDAYRDQNERVSALAVAFPVEEYVKDVPEPSETELRSFFDQYKSRLPDAQGPTPGFMFPRKIEVEYVSADVNALAREIEARLTEDELRSTFAGRPNDFPVPPPELPTNLFADDPEAKLTPRLGDPFHTVRELVARTLSREMAETEISNKFGLVQDDVFQPFFQRYGDALDAAAEAKEQGQPAPALPTPGDALKAKAAELGLFYERTPSMDRDLAEKYGQIGAARRGAGPFGGGTSFADEFFSPGKPLFEASELSDDSGRRFLAWKIADIAAREPRFEEARDDVLHAWKVQKARVTAENAAKAFAKTVETDGFDIQKAAGTRPVITTSPVTKLSPGLALDFMRPEPARPSEILQLPNAGPALRDALFSLVPKEVKVAPNQPETTYYVLVLNQRAPANLAGLYDSFGPRRMFQEEVQSELLVARIRGWLEELRRKAGLKPDWVPPEEARKQATQG